MNVCGSLCKILYKKRKTFLFDPPKKLPSHFNQIQTVKLNFTTLIKLIHAYTKPEDEYGTAVL